MTVATTAHAVAQPKRCPCHHYHVTAILTPTTADRAFPVVLREPVAALFVLPHRRLQERERRVRGRTR